MSKFFVIQFLLLLLTLCTYTRCMGLSCQSIHTEDIDKDTVSTDSCKTDSIEEYVTDFIKRHKNRTHLVYKKIELRQELKQFFIDSIISYARKNNYSPNEYTISLRAPRGYLLKDNVLHGSTSIYLEKNEYYSDGKNGNFESVPYYSVVDSFKCFIDKPTFQRFGIETSDSLIRKITIPYPHQNVSTKNHRWFFRILISKEKTVSFIKLSETEIDFNSSQLFYESITNNVIKGYIE